MQGLKEVMDKLNAIERQVQDNSGSLSQLNIKSLFTLKKLNRLLGLNLENYYLDNMVYSGDGQLKSGRIRTYIEGCKVGADAGVLATYKLEATYDGHDLKTYKVEKIEG